MFRVLESHWVIAAVWATPCQKLSRARKHDGLGPPPLRSDAYPKGLPTLKGHDLVAVEGSNRLVRVTAVGYAIADGAGAANVVENPWGSFLWMLDDIEEVLDQSGAARVLVDFCGYGTPYRKSTKFAGTLRNLPSLHRQCRSWRCCSFSGRPHVSLTGRHDQGIFRTKLADAYPVALCDALAALVLDAVARGGGIDRRPPGLP